MSKPSDIAELLKSNILELIRTCPNAHLLTDDIKQFMANSLTESIYRRINKFIKGQQEHGGNFLEGRINYAEEIRAEIDDLHWYIDGLLFYRDIA